MARILRSGCAVLVLTAACAALGLAAPARACGCGAYIPDRAGAAVVDERALVSWDGTTESIVMSFNVSGSSSTAAWVMPVPSAAEASLGDQQVFDELERITAPRTEYRDSWWPTFTWLFDEGEGTAGAPPEKGVDVLGRQRIGPFDVTRLAAGDAGALAKWLAGKGFPHPDGLDDNLAPYVDDGWEIVAIKLAPETEDESLTGTLQPLRLSFASDSLVYPMRLSKAAKRPQQVELYVLADHRMDPQRLPAPRQRPELAYAGRVERSQVGSALRDHVPAAAFLTRWDNHIGRPSEIDGDYVFTRASKDASYQRVEIIERNRGDTTGLILLATLAAAAVLMLVVIIRRRRTGLGQK